MKYFKNNINKGFTFSLGILVSVFLMSILVSCGNGGKESNDDEISQKEKEIEQLQDDIDVRDKKIEELEKKIKEQDQELRHLRTKNGEK